MYRFAIDANRKGELTSIIIAMFICDSLESVLSGCQSEILHWLMKSVFWHKNEILHQSMERV